MFHPRHLRNPTVSKLIRAIWLLTSILLGWVLGLVFLKPVKPKNVSPQTCQEPNPIKVDKGHMATDIYLIGLGAGPGFSETSQAQKCFTQDMSGTQPYQN